MTYIDETRIETLWREELLVARKLLTWLKMMDGYDLSVLSVEVDHNPIKPGWIALVTAVFSESTLGNMNVDLALYYPIEIVDHMHVGEQHYKNAVSAYDKRVDTLLDCISARLNYMTRSTLSYNYRATDTRYVGK